MAQQKESVTVTEVKINDKKTKIITETVSKKHDYRIGCEQDGKWLKIKAFDTITQKKWSKKYWQHDFKNLHITKAYEKIEEYIKKANVKFIYPEKNDQMKLTVTMNNGEYEFKLPEQKD